MASRVQEFEVHVEELPVLIPERDLKAFDEECVALVLEYQSYGWTGRMSSNNHAILRSPDGTATTSVSRKAKRNRSGLNARRKLQQWLKKRELEEQRKRNAFGLPAGLVEQEGTSPPWQVATHQSYEARLRMQKLTRDWWDDLVATKSMVAWQLMEADDDDWLILAVTQEDKRVRVVAAGPAAEPAHVEHMRAQAERFNHKQSKENPVQEEAGPQTESHDEDGFQCPLCDRKLGSPAGRGVHLRGKEHLGDPRLPQALRMLAAGKSAGGKPVAPPRPCEYCGKVKPAMSIGGHHRAHKLAGDVRIADRGDGATQAAEAITAPEPPVEVPEAVTAPPVQAEPLVVQAAPAVVEPAALNGTGHAALPIELLNQVRALVNPELVGDLERLRARVAELEAALEAMTQDRNELQALMDMIAERRTRTNANT